VDVERQSLVRLGHGEAGLDGVWIFQRRRRPHRPHRSPERCANLCFGGTYPRNRLFMAASTSLYALYVNTQGVAGG